MTSLVGPAEMPWALSGLDYAGVLRAQASLAVDVNCVACSQPLQEPSVEVCSVAADAPLSCLGLQSAPLTRMTSTALLQSESNNTNTKNALLNTVLEDNLMLHPWWRARS